MSQIMVKITQTQKGFVLRTFDVVGCPVSSMGPFSTLTAAVRGLEIMNKLGDLKRCVELSRDPVGVAPNEAAAATVERNDPAGRVGDESSKQIGSDRDAADSGSD